MSQSNIDYLYQVTAPTSDRSSTNARAQNDSTGFDDHLTQAAAPVFDLVRPVSRPEPRSSYSRSDQAASAPPRPSDSRDSGPERADRVNSSSGGDSASGSTSASSRSGEKQGLSDNSDDDRADDSASKTNDEAAAAAAGTTQPVEKPASAKSGDETHKTNRETDAEKAKATTETKAKLTAKTEQPADPAAEKAKAAELEAAAKVSTKEATQECGAADEATVSKDSPNDADSAKNSKRSRAQADAHKNGTTNNEAANGKQVIQVAASAASETGSVPQPGKEGAAEATAQVKAAAASAEKAKSKEPSDDEPGASDKSTVHANNRNEAAIAKTDATPIASGAAVSVADASGNRDAAKDDGDQAVKPVAAKGDTSMSPLGRALRATTETTRGARSAGTNDAPQVDPSRFVGRVAKAFQTATERGGTLQLRLSPPELGALRIQLTVKDGVMSATLEADNQNARRVLLDHLPALRDRLAEQNIRVEKFDVDVRQESNSGQADPRGFNQNPYQQHDQSEPGRATAPRRISDISVPEPIAVPQRIDSTGINLVV